MVPKTTVVPSMALPLTEGPDLDQGGPLQPCGCQGSLTFCRMVVASSSVSSSLWSRR